MTTTARTRHVITDPAILYFGTPVVLLSTINPDGSTNLAPISSVFWLGHQATIGINRASQSWANLARTGEVVLALPSVDLVDAVDRLALTTGRADMSADKRGRGYGYAPDKLAISGLTPRPARSVQPPLIGECPVNMECLVDAMADDPARPPLVELSVRQVHAHPSVLVAGRRDRIDPDRWRPLIMSFQQFYGLDAQRVQPSRLATIDEELYRPPVPR